MIGSTLDGVHVAGDRPPLVLLHGAGESHHAWDALVPHLAGPELLVPDLPGRAHSGPALDSVTDIAKVVAVMVRELGHFQVVVAGHSFGGAVALELALTEPELVCGLAMIASGARLRVMPSILDTLMSEPAKSDWRACNTFDRMSRVDEVAVPTRIIYGKNDVLTPPKYQAYLLEHITGAKGTELDASHDILRERPREVAQALMQLWSRFAP